jgi:hypothetical protein
MSFPEQPAVTPLPSMTVFVKDTPVWEYKQVVRDMNSAQALNEDELNALGAEGWEMVGILNATPLTYFYFKRLAK